MRERGGDSATTLARAVIAVLAGRQRDAAEIVAAFERRASDDVERVFEQMKASAIGFSAVTGAVRGASSAAELSSNVVEFFRPEGS